MILYLSRHPLVIFGTSQPSVGNYCNLYNVIMAMKFMSFYGLIKFCAFPQTLSFGFVLLVLIHNTYFMNKMIIITNRFIILWT
jgi:hypothetical protein